MARNTCRIGFPLSSTLFLIVLSFLVSACVTANQQPKAITWNRDSNEAIVHFQKPVIQPNDINYSLTELQRGLLFFNEGDYLHSDLRFANALRVMDKIGGEAGREAGAVVVDERTKTFKGEPYERATAYLFRGLCHFNRGDYAGALAAFRSSLAADAETRNKEQKYLEDFTISHFLVALTYERLSEHDNAIAALQMAKTSAPGNPLLASANLNDNFVAVLGVGLGPFKRGARTYTCLQPSGENVEVTIDSESTQRAAEATDLLVQAQSQQWGEADTARVARMIGKAVLSGILSGLTGANINIQDYEDARCWIGLPLKFFIYTATVPAGNHNITIKSYDRDGKEIERNRQIWFDVPVASANCPILYLPVQQDRQNYYGKMQVNINSTMEKAAK